EGELVYLREKSNLSTGGDAVNVTDQLTPEICKIAIDAGKAIPGLSHYGVDMIVSDDRKKGVILEVNSRPGLGGHMFPGQGKPRDFAKEIIDYYFAETRDKHRSDLYFDFDSILEAVMSSRVIDVDVIAPSEKKLSGRSFVLEIYDDISSDFRRFMRRQALIWIMHGYTELNEDSQVIIALLAEKDNLL